MNEYNIRGIPANTLGTFWRFAEPYIKRALDHTSGELKLEDLRNLCEDRAIQLWLISRGTRVIGAATTEIVVYPHRKHARVITLAGSDFDNWIEMADNHISEWAISQGCQAIESFVRKGLVQKMLHLAYRHKYSVIVKELP